VTEGSILIICSSLTALGPLFEAIRGAVFTANPAGRETHDQPETGELSRRIWVKCKGHKLESGSDSTLDLRPSFDAIPLVTTGNSEDAFQHHGPGIQKTIEVHVSSESFQEKGRRHARTAV